MRKGCEGCKKRRAAIVRTMQEMAARFRNPNAVDVTPREPVKTPDESESDKGK